MRTSIPSTPRGAPILGGERAPPRGFALQTTQRSEFVALNWMQARRPALAPAHMQPTGIELNLVSLQIANLGSPQSVTVGDQDHGRVTMPVPARLAPAGLGHQLCLLAGQERGRTIPLTSFAARQQVITVSAKR